MTNYLNTYGEESPYSEVGEYIQDAVHDARKATDGEVDFGNVQVKSVSEMGIAAGTYNTITGEIAVREDILQNREAIAELLPHVLIHEGRHKQCIENGGTASEGITELWASQESGHSPVDGYTSEVRHAVALQGVLGAEMLHDLAQNENAEENIALAYATAKVERHGWDFVAGWNEAVEHLNEAHG